MATTRRGSHVLLALLEHLSGVLLVLLEPIHDRLKTLVGVSEPLSLSLSPHSLFVPHSLSVWLIPRTKWYSLLFLLFFFFLFFYFPFENVEAEADADAEEGEGERE